MESHRYSTCLESDHPVWQASEWFCCCFVNIYGMKLCHGSCYSHLALLEKLLSACITCLKPEHLDLPIGLVGRLVLSGPAFIDQFISVVNSHNVSFSVLPYICFFSCISRDKFGSVVKVGELSSNKRAFE